MASRRDNNHRAATSARWPNAWIVLGLLLVGCSADDRENVVSSSSSDDSDSALAADVFLDVLEPDDATGVDVSNSDSDNDAGNIGRADGSLEIGQDMSFSDGSEEQADAAGNDSQLDAGDSDGEVTDAEKADVTGTDDASVASADTDSVGSPPCTAAYCDDSNPCTTDFCVPGAGCLNSPNLQPCDDGNPCTQSDTCQAGKCAAGKLQKCDDSNPCTKDTCQADVKDGCVHTAVNGPCNDGNPCTLDDTCAAKQCVGGKPKTCSGTNACAAVSCDTKTGTCLATPKADGTPCDDGNPCMTIDACQGGKCTGTKPLACDDGNPCTNDTCDPQKKCLHVPNTVACDDGDACTTSDKCAAGKCSGTGSCGDLLGAGVGKSACNLDGNLPQPSAIKLEAWFASVTKDVQTIDLTHLGDGTNRISIVDRRGYIYVFKNERYVKKRTMTLNLKSKVSTYNEGGLLSVAYHPNYKKNRKFYVNYTQNGVFSTVVSEFVANSNDVASAAAEKKLIVIKQPFGNHNGGQIFFDVTGKLLVGMGDGGSGGDPLNAGQRDDTLLGKMLRLDVDKVPTGKSYGIPADNPKLTMGHAAKWQPEVFAKGLRNPWRFSMDRLTGAVWIADVGQNAHEEIDILANGANFGWKILEGHQCYPTWKKCSKAGMTAPVHVYPHTQGRSVTGGYVYRGKANPQLYGGYIYADYVSGRFWSLRKVGDKYVNKELLNSNIKPVSFGEDENGELYVMALWGTNHMFRITQSGANNTKTTFPLLLSQTKCFKSIGEVKPAAGVVPYSVNAPLWSDGAHKHRHFVLPNGKGKNSKSIKLPADDTVVAEFPVGTLLVKTFAMAPKGTPAAAQKKVETRFMKRGSAGWEFYTYLWRDKDQTDAELILNGATRGFTLPSGAPFTWRAPSQSECVGCHQGPTGAAPLSASAAQLSRSNTYNGTKVEQLQAWHAAGLLDGYKGAGKHTAFVDQTELAAPGKALSDHARTYLHVQCASCHRPGGSSNTDLDLRYGTKLSATKGCEVSPKKGALGIANARLIDPGEPTKSTLWARMNLSPMSGDFMPSIAVSTKHKAAVALIEAWIKSLKGCN